MRRDVSGTSRLYLKALFEEGVPAGLTDGQLLERFARSLAASGCLSGRGARQSRGGPAARTRATPGRGDARTGRWPRSG